MSSPRLRRLRAIMVKETLQILRDPSSILIGFLLPVFLTLLSGYSVNLDIKGVPIGVVLEDASSDAQSLAAAFLATPYFKATVARDRRAFDDEMVSGKIRGMVVIRQDFTRRLERADESAPFQVISDGGEPNTATFVQNYAQGVWLGWMQGRALEKGLPFQQPVELAPRMWFNQELLSLNSLLPGGMAINLTLIGAMLTALVVAREWERGTMEAMMATPVGRFEMLAGKLVPYFVLGMAALFICLLITLLVFHIPFRGSILALSAVSAVFLVSALGMGLFISSAARNQFVAAQTSILAAFLPAYFLSGYVFETAGMPAPIRMLSYAISARYYVSCLKTLFLVGDAWPLLLPNMAGMAIIAFIFLFLSTLKTAKRIA